MRKKGEERHEPMNDERKGKSLKTKKIRTWTLHPGEILREEYLKPLGLTPYRLARELHVPVPRINDIVLEKESYQCRHCSPPGEVFRHNGGVLAGNAGRLRRESG